jgi:hypothetical protein
VEKKSLAQVSGRRLKFKQEFEEIDDNYLARDLQKVTATHNDMVNHKPPQVGNV